MEKQREQIVAELKESVRVKEACIADGIDTILRIADLIINAYQKGKKVILCGNGGSAADAQHLAGELMSKLRLERSPVPAIALTTNTSVLTAVGNDYDFESIFSRQVEAWANEGDVVIGISTSGSSPNVLKAMEAAKNRGAITVGFTGRDGRKLEVATDICFKVDSGSTPRIQEVHITVGHIICSLVEEALFGEK